MVTGGIAAVAYGVQRLTTDIDVILQADAVSIKQLVAKLRRQRILTASRAWRHSPSGIWSC
jgi:hypothetical protein